MSPPAAEERLVEAGDARPDLAEQLAVEDRGQVAVDERAAHRHDEAPVNALHVAQHAQGFGDGRHRVLSELEQLAKRARVRIRPGLQGDDFSAVFDGR